MIYLAYFATRNEEMVNMKYQDVFPKQTSAEGEPYIKFRLVFRKTNKDPNHRETSHREDKRWKIGTDEMF